MTSPGIYNTYIHFVLALLIGLAACRQPGETTNDEKTSHITEDNSDTLMKSIPDTGIIGKYKLYINSLPFPFKILDKTLEAGFPFDKNHLNPVNNATKYTLDVYKALALGIYGTDIAYCVTNEQFQEIGMYAKTGKKIADELHIPRAFTEEGLAKYELYRDNKDSLVNLIYRSYHEVDTALKTSEQISMAGLVVTGCWLEGLYLSTTILQQQPKTAKNQELYKTIWEQKYYLNNVLVLLDEFKQNDFFKRLITELEGIKSVYSSSSKHGEIDEAEVAIIGKKVEHLRNRITDALL